ncbi:unnamed protein product [Owenia fusiformis]|uniref:Uncharacterized protein n=1 Tax=Owenia fusiformis TaxID=6347 RepID=A0A8J1T4R6_OWEFU|nr:unnamed protein product [Owenia fusiformis]
MKIKRFGYQLHNLLFCAILFGRTFSQETPKDNTTNGPGSANASDVQESDIRVNDSGVAATKPKIDKNDTDISKTPIINNTDIPDLTKSNTTNSSNNTTKQLQKPRMKPPIPSWCYLKNVSFGSARPKPYTEFTLVMQTFVAGILALFGIVGNILAFFVLSQDTVNTSIVFLQALAVFDTLYLLVYLTFEPYHFVYLLTSWPDKTKTITHAVHAIEKHYSDRILPVETALICMSTWTVVILTVDRFIAVCMPLAAHRLCTIKRAAIQIACISVLSIAYSVPRFFENEGTVRYQPCLQVFMYIYGRTKLGANLYFRAIYSVVLGAVIRFVIPVVIVVAMNILLILALRRSSRERQELVGNENFNKEKQNQNITLTLVAVATVYLICLIPGMALELMNMAAYWNTSINTSKFREVSSFLTTIANVLLVFNSSINFVIYCVTRKNFRKNLKKRLSPKVKGRVRKAGSIGNYTVSTKMSNSYL